MSKSWHMDTRHTDTMYPTDTMEQCLTIQIALNSVNREKLAVKMIEHNRMLGIIPHGFLGFLL